jgi:hypothetical protein
LGLIVFHLHYAAPQIFVVTLELGKSRHRRLTDWISGGGGNGREDAGVHGSRSGIVRQ